MKRPKPMTLEEQWKKVSGLPDECFIKPPSTKSFIVVGAIWMITIILFIICGVWLR